MLLSIFIFSIRLLVSQFLLSIEFLTCYSFWFFKQTIFIILFLFRSSYFFFQIVLTIISRIVLDKSTTSEYSYLVLDLKGKICFDFYKLFGTILTVYTLICGIYCAEVIHCFYFVKNFYSGKIVEFCQVRVFWHWLRSDVIFHFFS